MSWRPSLGGFHIHVCAMLTLCHSLFTSIVEYAAVTQRLGRHPECLV